VEDAKLEAVEKAAWRGREIAVSQANIMNLINRPGNKLFPGDFAEAAVQSGQSCGFEVTIMDKATIEALGMGGLLGVNKGSAEPPVFIVMEYKGEGENLKKVALVGKGVTFDTGGVSIKPSTNMYYMKSDMGGAAAVFGTMEVVSKLKLPVHLIGIIPATDNKLGADAIVPGDILHSYSGITIEVEDTDAEGRLILADGLSYVIQNHEPDVVIDLATLTGACVFALGYHAAGLFTQNDQLAADLTAAGQRAHERVWRLPLWDDYAPQLHSDVADIKNYGGRPAGAVTAAKFLEKFTHKHPAWAHLDIAGVAFGDAGQGKGKTGTGFGPGLLLSYLEGLIESE
jgi:leucyl aminopeptidase